MSAKILQVLTSVTPRVDAKVLNSSKGPDIKHRRALSHSHTLNCSLQNSVINLKRIWLRCGRDDIRHFEPSVHPAAADPDSAAQCRRFSPLKAADSTCNPTPGAGRARTAHLTHEIFI